AAAFPCFQSLISCSYCEVAAPTLPGRNRPLMRSLTEMVSGQLGAATFCAMVRVAAVGSVACSVEQAARRTASPTAYFLPFILSPSGSWFSVMLGIGDHREATGIASPWPLSHRLGPGSRRS